MAIEPSSSDLQRFREGDDGKPVVILQLLRFNEGGRDRYLRYSAAAQSILMGIGAQVLYAGECGPPLVAAGAQGWDAIVLVRYPNRTAYVEMLADPAYQAIVDQRRSALREALLVPVDDWPGR